MPKRALFKIGDGNFAEGFTWSLQLGEENALPTVEVEGRLPPDVKLQTQFEQWSQTYSQLGTASRPIGLPKSPRQTSPASQPSAQNIPDVRSACQQAAIALNQQFNQWLRHTDVLPLREALLEQVQTHDPLRIILQTRMAQVQRLPWHQWDLLERFPKAELALSRPIYRTVDSETQPPSSRVKILAILGDSRGIDIESDRQAFAQLPHADVTFLVEPQRAELTEQLWQQPWQILFFAGHSRTIREQGTARNQGELAINPHEKLTLEQLKYALQKSVSQGLQLAIFNSCDGLGLAQAFAHLDIPQLIVMREPVPDQVAQAFLQSFLQAYTQGQPLYPAVREARERLQGLEGTFPCATWLPIIFQNPAVEPPTWRSLHSTPNDKTNAIASQPLSDKQSQRLGQKADSTFDQTSPSQISSQQPPNRRINLKALALKTLGLSTAIATTVLGIRHIGLLQPLELRTYDQFLQLRPDEPPDDRILVIQITEADVQAQQNEQPRGSLSDQSLSQLLTLLQPHNPAAIGLDIYRDYPAQLPALAKQMQSHDRLFTVCRTGSGNGPENPNHQNDTGIAPAPEATPERLGFSDNVLDADDATRRHLIAMEPPANSACTTPYALSTLLSLQYLANQGIEWQWGDRGEIFLGDTEIPLIRSHSGSYQQVDPWGFQTLLNYRSHKGLENAFATLTLQQVLTAKFSPAAIQDRIILIGTTAPSFRDTTPTPYSKQTPGVFVQAQMVSQLLSVTLDGRPLLTVLPRWNEALWIAAWAWMGGGLTLLMAWRKTLRDRPWLSLGLILLSSAILHIALTLIVLVTQGLWLSPLPPLFALGLSGGTSVKLLQAQHRDRSRVKVPD